MKYKNGGIQDIVDKAYNFSCYILEKNLKRIMYYYRDDKTSVEVVQEVEK